MTTIREQLKQQAVPFRRARWTGVAIATAVAVLVVFLRLPKPVQYAAVFGTLLVTGGVCFVLLKRLRCPRCNASLYSNSHDIARGADIKFCPHCGASFDEPIKGVDQR
jgi:hypothetical protein